MASQGTVTAAVIGAVATIAATVLAIVLPRVLADNPSPSGPPTSGIEVTQGQPPAGGGAQETVGHPADSGNDGGSVGSGETELSLNVTSAPVGATVKVSGRGFQPNETVEIRFSAQLVGTARAGRDGSFANAAITVPEFFRNFPKPMDQEITATGKSSIRSANVAFTISA